VVRTDGVPGISVLLHLLRQPLRADVDGLEAVE
jgi:hypothetical protein